MLTLMRMGRDVSRSTTGSAGQDSVLSPSRVVVITERLYLENASLHSSTWNVDPSIAH
jgi:hypothetical protein